MKTNWPTKKLGEVCGVNPKLKNDLAPSLEVGFLTMADVSENAKIIRIQEKKLSEVKKGFTNFINGDVLVAKITPCFENGKGAFVEKMPNGIGFGSTEFHVLRTNNDLLNKYLYYFVSNRSFRVRNAMFMTGSAGQRRVPTDFLKKIKIPLPPLAIQKQIVERLDKIAEAQKLNDGLIQKTDELFQSLLHKELNPAGKNWEINKMEVLVKNVKIGPFGSALKIAELSDNGPVRVLFIENVVNNKFELAKEKYISEKKYKELEVYTVEPDDILITMMGTIGRTCITPKNLGRAIISSHLIKITPNKKIAIPEYLNFSLHSPYVTDQIRRKAKGAIMKGLNSKILRNLDIPLPSLEIQKQIVAKLSAAQEYGGRLLEQKVKLKELFDSVLSNSMNQSV